ncbi:tam domain methyltransferase protein [Diplodia corticola]|uniref:Tam domain methyltransferase protein n=1 Tax=Diplodia corticola TaxID=236234 RepID=A0A1J9R602_9PEZI|nr:tam domain methyltransferase protein [Diplodia corticola]OJD35634.1 tam domain methyltransferase protein [Diplodia corticola]
MASGVDADDRGSAQANAHANATANANADADSADSAANAAAAEDSSGSGGARSQTASEAFLDEITQSVSASIYEGRYENGRRYHTYREGAYPLPEDEREQDRLDLIQHWFGLVLKGELQRAPLDWTHDEPSDAPRRVLDVGTGTGLWALDFADLHPDAQVIGTDLSVIQPEWTAPNCHFIIDDAESDWIFTDKESFDYVHVRYLYPGIGDWERLWQQSFEHLRPGGWAESQEISAWFYSDEPGFEHSNIQYWQQTMDDATARIGKRFNRAHEQKDHMIKAGFVNVVQEIIEVPMGTWDKQNLEIGKCALLNAFEGLAPTSLAIFSRVLDWDMPQIETLLAAVRNEFLYSRWKTHAKFYFTYGQKPADA